MKLVMAALALEMGGNVDALNHRQARTNQMTYDNSNRAGERQSHFWETRLVYYFVPARQRNANAARTVAFSALCVPEASLPLSLNLVCGGTPL